MTLLEQIRSKAKAANKTIVLAEGTEERTLKAADIILKEGIARLILLGNEAEIKGLANQWGLQNIDKATIIDPVTNPKREYYAQMLCEIRKKKGMQMDEAMKLVADPLYFSGADIICQRLLGNTQIQHLFCGNHSSEPLDYLMQRRAHIITARS